MSIWRSKDRYAWPGSRLTLAALVLVAYPVAAFYPFDFEPLVIVNSAEFLPQGGYRFTGPGIVRTERVPQWVVLAMDLHSIRVQLRVRSFAADQSGPARILTLSLDPHHRNFTVAQDHRKLVLRLRTPATSQNGIPALHIPEVFEEHEWVDVQIVIERDQLKVKINGVTRLDKLLPPRSFKNWDSSYKLALGNELTMDRPWRGEIGRVHIQVGEVAIDYSAPSALQRPRLLWSVRRVELIPFARLEPGDAAVNFVGFVPLGFVLGIWAMWRGWHKGWRPIVFVLAVSLGLEVLQLGFAGRYTSINDLIFNVLGGGTGILISRWLRRDTTRV